MARQPKEPAPESEPESDNRQYVCRTCEAVTRGRRHLCSPPKSAPARLCSYCRHNVAECEHVCVPMLASLRFSCRKCGRLAPRSQGLCDPQAVR
jgi:hypothetical protein